MAKNEKTQAEKYREQRKKRIAKSKKSAGSVASKIAGRVLAVILCLAILFGIGTWVTKLTGVDSRISTALKVGGQSVNATTYSYYYYNIFSQITQYASYGYMQYDTSLSPEEQNYPVAKDDGSTQTYAEYFSDYAKEQAQTIAAYSAEAKKAGMKIDEEHQAQIDEAISTYSGYADSAQMTLNSWLSRYFGNGMNKRQLTKILENSALAEMFQSSKDTEIGDGIKEEDIKAEYDKDPTEYQAIDVRYASLEGATEAEAKDVLKKINSKNFKATVDEFNAKPADDAKDDAAADTAEASTTEAPAEEEKDTTLYTDVKKASLTSAISEDAAKWVFANAKAGAKNVFSTDTGYTVVVVESGVKTNNSVTVRYCLVPYNDNKQKAADDAEVTAAKANADKYYSDFCATKKTEDDFANICKEHSADDSTASDGGLITFRKGEMVSAFEKWCYDSARKPGDCEVIEAEEYGFFLIYFVSNNTDDLDWQNTIKTNLKNDAYEAYNDELLADSGAYKVEVSSLNEKVIKKTEKSAIRLVTALMAANNQSAQ